MHDSNRSGAKEMKAVSLQVAWLVMNGSHAPTAMLVVRGGLVPRSRLRNGALGLTRS